MPKLRTTVAGDQTDEFTRNAAIVADKLRGKGVIVAPEDSPEDLVTLLETVESFEEAVRVSGGDLMVDEPPEGREAQPDDARFVLPARRQDEDAPSYAARVSQATMVARGETPS